ncbi:hypothetical protein LWI29_005732 [Acer saccharum]|uniref:Uncharacterized protein n=1 Tax=Acer saccharum TaxID=4024 RepID=A0AA39TDL7_ACESA|nr:hypothetical protein LWI29_005732 [Acer saccharum]
MLLENQLPIFILDDLFTLAKTDVLGNSLSQLAKFFFKCHICKDVLIDENLIDSYFSKAKHFVDLLRICLRPPKRDDTKRLDDSEVVPNVTKLHQAGVKFKLAPTTMNLLDIRFNKGTLEIPKLTIGNMTEQLLRNLHIFKGLHCDHANYMNDYGVILNCLLNTSKDVELLIHIGVIDNRILDSEGVSNTFSAT